MVATSGPRLVGDGPLPQDRRDARGRQRAGRSETVIGGELGRRAYGVGDDHPRHRGRRYAIRATCSAATRRPRRAARTAGARGRGLPALQPTACGASSRPARARPAPRRVRRALGRARGRRAGDFPRRRSRRAASSRVERGAFERTYMRDDAALDAADATAAARALLARGAAARAPRARGRARRGRAPARALDWWPRLCDEDGRCRRPDLGSGLGTWPAFGATARRRIRRAHHAARRPRRRRSRACGRRRGRRRRGGTCARAERARGERGGSAATTARAPVSPIARRVSGSAAATPRSGTRGSAPRRTRSRSQRSGARRLRSFQRAPSTRTAADRARSTAAGGPRAACARGTRMWSSPWFVSHLRRRKRGRGGERATRYIEREKRVRDGTNARGKAGGLAPPPE